MSQQDEQQSRPDYRRKGISKSRRFQVFARDNFQCRYCGRQSDVVALVIDHVHPVSHGGTNDVENLITSCHDCNLGKGARTIEQSAPTDADRLRIAQERNEQVSAYLAVRQTARARDNLKQEVCDYWCTVTGRDEVDSATLSTVTRYVEEFGAHIVFGWIDRAYASVRFPDDRNMGKYISGIRRIHRSDRFDV